MGGCRPTCPSNFSGCRKFHPCPLLFGRWFGISATAMPINPIIAISRPDPFDDPAYLFELKYDGFRALADTVNGRTLSKNKNRMKRFEGMLESLPAPARPRRADSEYSLRHIVAEPGAPAQEYYAG